MRIILTNLLLIAIQLTSFARDSTVVKHKLYIGLNFTPLYSYRTNIFYNGSSTIKATEKIEDAQLSFSFGIPVSYKIKNRISINSGIIFSNKQMRSPKYNLITGNIPVYDAQLWEEYKASFIELPFGFGFALINKRIGINLNAGIINNYLLNESLNSHLHYLSGSPDIVKKKIVQKANKFSLSAYTGISIDYNLNKIKLSMQPMYCKFLTPHLETVNNYNYIDKVFLNDFRMNFSVYINLK
jgi:hypothetical protein